MVRSRVFLPISLLIVGSFVGAWMTLAPGLNSEATAQARGQAPVRIAVVDFTRLNQGLADVEKISDLLRQFEQLSEATRQNARRRITDMERDLQQGRAHRMDPAELERIERELLEMMAAFEAEEKVIEFRARRAATMYSSRVLQKILERIEAHSAGTYDLVFKVLGDPTGEHAEEDLTADAQRLNLARAREILYYSTESGVVTDITETVRRAVNLPGGTNDVSRALDRMIAQVREEIEEARSR